MPASPRGNRPPGRALTRRRLAALAAGGVLLGLAGCSGDPAADRPEPTPTASPRAATPAGVVPGFDDSQRWAGRTLRVAAWGGEVQAALQEMVWQPFAKATGCAIQPLFTDYGQFRQSVAAGAPYADALVVDSEFAAGADAAGQLHALTQPAARQQADLIRGAGNPVPAYAYAIVGAYRRDAIVAAVGPPRIWAEWWDFGRFPGNRALAKDPLGTFEFALLADGVAANKLYPLDADRAIASLKKISGKIVDRWWEAGDQPVAWLTKKRTDFTTAWHYRVTAAQDGGQPVELVWDQGLLLTDAWIVPAGAAGADVAGDFLRYATTPQVQAALAQRSGLGPVAAQAFDRLDPLVAGSLPTAPINRNRLIDQDVAFWVAHRGEMEERFNSWLLGVVGG